MPTVVSLPEWRARARRPAPSPQGGSHGTLHDAVLLLPLIDRTVLRLRFEENLPLREIARLLDFPSSFAVARRIEVLLGRLREEFLGASDARHA